MVKAPVKRKPKQKVKQKVKVSQNVKVIVGDVKRKRVVKSNTKTSPAKPPIVLNISNPQPNNNMFMEYFRKQLQNQQPVHANTLLQQERLNEREENIASRAGALAKIDQEPNDVAREMRRQAVETRAKIEQADAERRRQEQEMSNSFKTPPSSKRRSTPKRKTTFRPIETPEERANPFMHLINNPDETDEDAEANMVNAMEQQRNSMEMAITKGGAGAGAIDEAEEEKSGKVEKPQAKRGPKPSDLPIPNGPDARERALEELSQYDEQQLAKRLTGRKLNQYMKALQLKTHMRGSTNPRSANDQRIAIIGLVYNYKRDQEKK